MLDPFYTSAHLTFLSFSLSQIGSLTNYLTQSKDGCTPRAKLRYARDACDAKLRGFQSPLCIFNMCVHTDCEATPAILATSRAWFDRSLGRRFYLKHSSIHACACEYFWYPPAPHPLLYSNEFKKIS